MMELNGLLISGKQFKLFKIHCILRQRNSDVFVFPRKFKSFQFFGNFDANTFFCWTLFHRRIINLQQNCRNNVEGILFSEIKIKLRNCSSL